MAFAPASAAGAGGIGASLLERNFRSLPAVNRIETRGFGLTDTTEDDRLLIEAAQADPARFVEIYERYVDRIYAFVSRRTDHRAAAEDITSQVFEQALTSIGRFEWRGLPVSVWLFRIASNALADHWRERSRDAVTQLPDVPDLREGEDLDRRIALYREVERLPDAQRRVIQMRFVEEKSIREVAVALNRSEGAVKQLQLRALEKLRKSMAGDG
jgi:RNA polymerase sigma-70 factor (ECF subfamily)